jgi:hypothetical protein
VPDSSDMCEPVCESRPDSASDTDVLDTPTVAADRETRCSRCGAEQPRGNRCRGCGSFLPANEAALKHGLRRYQTTGRLPEDLRISAEDFRAGIISDQGGLDELSTVQAGLVRLLFNCEVGTRILLNEVLKRGIDTAPGRAAYDRLLSTMDRWNRIAGTLGIERKQKPVTDGMSYLRQQLAAVEKERQG